MWSYDNSRSALGDVLRLSSAMTYKMAVADLPLGGGKGVIMLSPHTRLSSERRQHALLDFADTVAALHGRYITAEDVGTSSRDMSVIAERTKHVAGLSRSRGGSGDPSPSTALGVESAIRACCERVFGDDSLSGRTICVIGLGHVGSRVAKRCATAGAKLILADVDESKRHLAEELKAKWTSPEEALEAEAEVLAPCALGGILNDESVPRLRCRIIAGAANNQLSDERVADLLTSRGILWAPDFVANAGGVINIAEEFGSYNAAAARRRVRGIADTLRRIFDDADAMGATPLTAAMELARRRLVPSASGGRG
jgi:leucine dehydrogenase